MRKIKRRKGRSSGLLFTGIVPGPAAQSILRLRGLFEVCSRLTDAGLLIMLFKRAIQYLRGLGPSMQSSGKGRACRSSVALGRSINALR